MTGFGFGIVGTGMIAKVVADAIEAAANARLAAVSSRTKAKAEAFVAGRPGTQAVEGLSNLLAHDDVDAVYVAIPTVVKEEVALAAIASGKHVLVDKPFMDARSVDRMAHAATAANLVFMDATHFVHHPRRDAIRAALAERTGRPRVLHSVFYTDRTERSNIRFDPALEPMGALGDLGWYCMRAIVEYLQPQGAVVEVAASCQRDAETGAAALVTGLFAFESGESASFGAGFQCGTTMNELSLVGDQGVITLDDFVMNWTNSFAFQTAEVPTGYIHRSGSMTPRDFSFVETPSRTPQQVLMVQNFADLAISGDRQTRADHVVATTTTQRYLDAVWAKIAVL